MSADKPGNVGRHQAFSDASYEDFLLSAAAIAPVMAAAGSRPVGATILRAVRETRRWVTTNTNLGIVLLLAPLARAAVAGGALRDALLTVLRELTQADAEDAYEAIRLASPGGLGAVEGQDVRTRPTVSLLDAMRLAADRDTIAREYATGYAVTFELAVPVLRAARARGASWASSTTECFLSILAAVPDTLIARKRGLDLAAAVSRRATRVLATGEAGSPERREAIARLQAELSDRSHSLNPGTTADLTAAALFVILLDTPSPLQE